MAQEHTKDLALMRAFGDELRCRRNASRLSQDELARRADINRTFVAKIEQAKNQPSLSVLHRLALALDHDLPDVIIGTLRRYKIEIGRTAAKDD